MEDDHCKEYYIDEHYIFNSTSLHVNYDSILCMWCICVQFCYSHIIMLVPYNNYSNMHLCSVIVSKLACFCTMISSYKNCCGGTYTFLLAIWAHYIQCKQHTDHEVPNWSEYTGYMEFCTRNRKHNHGITIQPLLAMNWYCIAWIWGDTLCLPEL